MTPGEHPTVSVSSAKVFQRQAVALHGLDDLRDGRLPLRLGVPLGLGKEGTGLLQQILEPALAQGLLPAVLMRWGAAWYSVGAACHVGIDYP